MNATDVVSGEAPSFQNQKCFATDVPFPFGRMVETVTFFHAHTMRQSQIR